MGSPREKTEVAALREELRQTKTQLATWQEAWKQAKHAADLWKKEAEDAHHAARHASRRAEELDSKVKSLQLQGPIRTLAESADVSRMSLSELEQVKVQMRQDIERIDTVRPRKSLTKFILTVTLYLSPPPPFSLSLSLSRAFVIARPLSAYSVKSSPAAFTLSHATTASSVKTVPIKWGTMPSAPIVTNR